MTSSVTSAPGRRYNLSYSRSLLRLEILSFAVILVCLLWLISGYWLAPVILLYLLLTIQFFNRRSVLRQFANPRAIELRVKPEPSICYYQQGESCFSYQQVSIKCSRWFILVKLRNASQQFDHILLADSFDNPAQYSQFRRQLLEIFDVS